MLKHFPSISTTNATPIEKLSEGESYYIKTSDSCVHGKIVQVTDSCVHVRDQRSISGTNMPDAIYLKCSAEHSTFQDYDETKGHHHGIGVAVCMAVSPHNDELAVGLTTNVVNVWKIVTGEHVATLGDFVSHHTVSCVCYSPNGKYIVAGSSNGYLYVWENATKQLLHKEIVANNYISSLKFNSDNDTIMMHSVTRHGSHLWSVSQRKFLYSAYSVSINRHTPALLRKDSYEQMQELFSENIYANAVAFSPDGTIISMVSTINVNRSAIALWRHRDGKFMLLNIQDYEGHYTTICFSPSGEDLMLCGENGTVSILNATDLSVVYCLTGPTAIHSANYSPSGEHIVTCGLERSVRVLEVATWDLVESYAGEPIEDYNEDYDGVVTAEFSKDSTKLVICFPFYIKEVPWISPKFVPDEFKTQLAAEWISRGKDLPDNAKFAICEFLHGVSMLL
jgi:WD40 repeat protein